MKLWRYSGIFLLATGIIHTIYALVVGWGTFAEMFRDGFVNSVGDNIERDRAVWFLACGVVLIFFGQVLQQYLRKVQQPTPLFFGWGLLFLSVILCLVVPISGAWLFLPQALIIIFAKRKLLT